jgi:hypothetical protein
VCLVGGARRTVCATRGARRVPPPGATEPVSGVTAGTERQKERHTSCHRAGSCHQRAGTLPVEPVRPSPFVVVGPDEVVMEYQHARAGDNLTVVCTFRLVGAVLKGHGDIFTRTSSRGAISASATAR